MTHILVVHPGSLGDTMLALPVLDALKQSHHPAALHLIGHPSLVDLLPGHCAVDAMSSIEGPHYQELLSGAEPMRPALARFFLQFDIIVIWAADPEGTVRRALDSLRIARIVVQSPGLRSGDLRHATDRFRDTVRGLLRGDDLPAARLTLKPQDRESADGWLSASGVNPDRAQVVAVHAGSGSPAKCWSPDRFGTVIGLLLGRHIQVVLIEGPADEHVTCRVAGALAVSLPRLHDASLTMLAGVLSRCHAFLGNDSGVTHLASAVGVPTVAVFGPTDPALWAARLDNVVTVRPEGGCRCPTSEAQRTCAQPVCLATTPQLVLATLQSVLRRVAPNLATGGLVC